jgi:hypothetical protein
MFSYVGTNSEVQVCKCGRLLTIARRVGTPLSWVPLHWNSPCSCSATWAQRVAPACCAQICNRSERPWRPQNCNTLANPRPIIHLCTQGAKKLAEEARTAANQAGARGNLSTEVDRVLEPAEFQCETTGVSWSQLGNWYACLPCYAHCGSMHDSSYCRPNFIIGAPFPFPVA